MQIATGLQAGREAGDQRRLNQPALVVFFLVPGVGEKNVNAVQAGQRQHVVDDLDRVVLQDADVAQIKLGNALEQRADAGRVDLAAEEVFIWHQRRDVRCSFAHAEADFKNGRGLASECGWQRQGRSGVAQQDRGANVFKSFGLRDGGAPGAAHEAANRPVVFAARNQFGHLG